MLRLAAWLVGQGGQLAQKKQIMEDPMTRGPQSIGRIVEDRRHMVIWRNPGLGTMFRPESWTG